MNRPVAHTTINRLPPHEAGNPVYTYDAQGNMTTMPHLTALQWDRNDRLRSASNGTVTSWYCYDASGNRTRKVTLKPGDIKEERIYLGSYELYRKTTGNTTTTERQTLHVMDDTRRVAMIDRLTIDNGITLSTPVVSIRYQYDNHLGSASLELDQNAAIISYEEYHPFGTTSYRSGRTETEVALKRYKYVGKERDEETGLYYYGARYYAAWIARFVSVDPLQLKYPYYTPYQYAGNKPVSYIDLDGLEEAKTTEEKKPEERKSESITPMKSKNADLFEVPMEEGDFSLRKIPELSNNNFIITGEGSKLFIDLLSMRTGLSLGIKNGYVEITEEKNDNTTFTSKVLAGLVKDIIAGNTEKVFVNAVQSDEDIAFDQFPFEGDNQISYYSELKDNYVDMDDLLNINDAPELQAAFLGIMLTERANASIGFDIAHEKGFQVEGDIIREMYPNATNRIVDNKREMSLEGKPVSKDNNDKRTAGGFFDFTIVSWVTLYMWNANSSSDIKRINRVSGIMKTK